MGPLNFYNVKVWNHFSNAREIVEMRILNAYGFLNGKRIWGKIVFGYFDNHLDFCKALKDIERLEYSGAYFTLHVIDPRLIGRAFNRLKEANKEDDKAKCTTDNHVIAYRWLPLDFDPIRLTGISSTDQELQMSIDLRNHIIPIIQERYGLPSPLLAISGNGCHALFRLPDWPVDQEHRDIMVGLLKTISDEFSTDFVKIDQGVFNPSRIWKLYGTTAHKGDPVPAGKYREARPHRESFIEKLGGTC